MNPEPQTPTNSTTPGTPQLPSPPGPPSTPPTPASPHIEIVERDLPGARPNQPPPPQAPPQGQSITLTDEDFLDPTPRPAPPQIQSPPQTPDRVEITLQDVDRAARTSRPGITLRPEDFTPPAAPPRPPPPLPRSPSPRPPATSTPVPRPSPAPPVTTAVAAPVAASGWATLFKALAVFLVLGVAGTSGLVALKNSGWHSGSQAVDLALTKLEDTAGIVVNTVTGHDPTPAEVVTEYLAKKEAGEDFSSLLTEESKRYDGKPGDAAAGPLNQLADDNKEMKEMASAVQEILNSPEFKKTQQEASKLNQNKTRWRIKGERIEGDTAWVSVELEDSLGGGLAQIEANIELNKRNGQEEAARLQEAYLAEKRKQLEALGGQSFINGMRNLELPFLCKREGGKWKVDLAAAQIHLTS